MNRMNQDIVDMFNETFNTNLKLNRGSIHADDNDCSYLSLDNTEYEVLLRTGKSTSISFTLNYMNGESLDDFKNRLLMFYYRSIDNHLVILEKRSKQLKGHYDLILTKARGEVK